MTEHTSGQYEEERVTRRLVSKPEREALARRLAKLTPQERAKILDSIQPRIVEKYMAHIPHPRQQVFLSLKNREVMFGGSGGGGKSDALLMSALQYVDVPGYSALLLRTTWPDLNKAGAILDRANQWFGGTDARKRDGGRLWEFPTFDKNGNEALPARISFGYLDKENDKYKLQCFTSDHDILTSRGWIPVDKVTVDDLVASVDPVTQLMSFESVSTTHAYDYKGMLVDIFQANGLSMRVTPNHAIWVKDDNGGLTPVRADRLRPEHLVPLTVTMEQGNYLEMDEHDIAKIAQQDLKSHTVRRAVKFLSPANMVKYLEALAHIKTNGRLRISITTRQKEFLDNLMELGTLAGLRCTMSRVQAGNYGSRYELSWNRTVPNQYAKMVNAIERPTAQNYLRYTKSTGKVYCVSTPKYQTLVVRHRGRVHVSGNSAEYQFIGYDELTQFNPAVYTYSFSRLRKPAISCINCTETLKFINSRFVHSQLNKKCKVAVPDPMVIKQYQPAPDGLTIFDIPLRVRSASNPGGRSHEYVRDRFVNPKTRDERSLFIPSSIHDNPSLNYDEYVESLSYLDPLEKARMLNGDWDVSEMGEMFERDWFKLLRTDIEPQGQAVRWWDNASSDGKGDYTVGLKLIKTKDGRHVISDIVRGQWGSMQKKKIMKQTAQMDGISVAQRMEQEPGSSGVDVIDDMRRNVFAGYSFQGIRSTGDKVTRATPVASVAEGGILYMMPGQWNKAFIDEMIQFPNGNNDDQVDALASAYNHLSGGRKVRLLV